MPVLDHLPQVDSCCACVTDLKAATAIIAVLGIVTSPALAWAMVRHAYAIRMSCFVTTATAKPDVIDIHLNNVISFGFGTNAGIAPSCLASKGAQTNEQTSMFTSNLQGNSDYDAFISTIKVMGWIVLLFDSVFVFCCIHLLFSIFQNVPGIPQAISWFTLTGFFTIFLSFCYGIMFSTACIIIGGNVPVYEIIFTFVDFITWLYFFTIVNSFRRKPPAN